MQECLLPRASAIQKPKRFLGELKCHLNAGLPSRDEVRRRVREAVAFAKASKGKKEKSRAFPEGAFLNEFVIPVTYEFLTMKTEPKLSPQDARISMLSESYKSHPTMASASPASLLKHPFTKTLGTSAAAISQRWWDKTGQKSCISQSCPDLGLCAARTKLYLRLNILETGELRLQERPWLRPASIRVLNTTSPECLNCKPYADGRAPRSVGLRFCMLHDLRRK